MDGKAEEERGKDKGNSKKTLENYRERNFVIRLLRTYRYQQRQEEKKKKKAEELKRAEEEKILK